MMSPKRLEEMKRLAAESTPFATESSLVSDRLRHALKEAIAEIEELQRKNETLRQLIGGTTP